MGLTSVDEVFQSPRDAAKVIAQYWQGKKMDREVLLTGIQAFCSRINDMAYFQFAMDQTALGTPERTRVDQAQDYIIRYTFLE